MTRNQRFNTHPQPHPHRSKKQQVQRKERKANSYLADDDNFPSFAIQLKKLGLQLRDIPGDGNCLFRALGDQLEGHCRNHFKHRQDTVQFMLDHRYDFEPFVEDDEPFDRHVDNLRKQGTYAGNDAIVAFAKLHNVNVMIHQLNGNPLMIQGPAHGVNIQQLHIAYHNGDHYSSIRRHGDTSESPANIRLQEDKVASPDNHHPGYHQGNDLALGHSGVDYLHSEVMMATGCESVEHIQEALEDCDYSVDAAIATLMQTMELGGGVEEEQAAEGGQSSLWGPGGTANRIFGGGGSSSSSSSSGSAVSGKGSGARPKHSLPSRPEGQVPKSSRGRRIKENKKAEKKRRAEERHRERIIGGSTEHQRPRQLDEDEEAVIITHGVTRI